MNPTTRRSESLLIISALTAFMPTMMRRIGVSAFIFNLRSNRIGNSSFFFNIPLAAKKVSIYSFFQAYLKKN